MKCMNLSSIEMCIYARVYDGMMGTSVLFLCLRIACLYTIITFVYIYPSAFLHSDVKTLANACKFFNWKRVAIIYEANVLGTGSLQIFLDYANRLNISVPLLLR